MIDESILECGKDEIMEQSDIVNNSELEETSKVAEPIPDYGNGIMKQSDIDDLIKRLLG